MKKVKQRKTNVRFVFAGGVSMQFDTTHSMQELDRIMSAARDSGEAAIDNVEDEMEIADSGVTIYTEQLLTYIVIEYNTSNLITPDRKLSRVQ
jgi:hypothetical protein